VVIERSDHGQGIITRIKDDYTNLYRHIDVSAKFADDLSDTIGFPMQRNKGFVVDQLAEWLDCGSTDAPKQPKLLVRSHQLIAEMPTFVIDEKTGKVGAPKGQHDDTLMAMTHAITGVVHTYVNRGARRKSFAHSWQF
jgi:hypothetical protein